MPVYANPKEIGELTVELTNAALQCRDLGHNWRTQNVERVGRGFKRTLKCTRGCRVFRQQTLDHYGRVGTNNYSYPDTGYRFKKATGRIAGDAKAAIRLSAIYREMERLNGNDSDNDLRQASGSGADTGNASDTQPRRKGARG